MSEEQSLKQKTAKGLFWGGLSSSVQQLLGLLFGVVLGRLLDPADYGMIGMLAIFPAIASALQESGFVAALANREKVSDKDYNAVFWFSISFSAVLYILLYSSAPLIAKFYDTPELTSLARFSFLSFFIASFGIAPRALLFRNLKVKENTIISVSIRYCGDYSCRKRICLLGSGYTDNDLCRHRHGTQLVLCPLEAQLPH